MRLTFRHLLAARKRRKNRQVALPGYFGEATGLVTVNYPYETVPVPSHGRYQLHNEIEDCIVCDKCAKICPVNCIDIVPIKSPVEFGKTADGTPKRIYAATFDIDMAKCCFCGLCTTVCPTECLTMTPEYDFSVFDLGKLNFGFGNLTEVEAAQKRAEWETAQAQKAAARATTENPQKEEPGNEAAPATGFRPRMPSRPAIKPKPQDDITENAEAPAPTKAAETAENQPAAPPRPLRARPVMPKPSPPTPDAP